MGPCAGGALVLPWVISPASLSPHALAHSSQPFLHVPCNNPRFETVMMILILGNIVALSINHYGMTQEIHHGLELVSEMFLS